MLSLLKTLIKENPGSEEARVSAAIEIQRAYRGYSTRYGKKNKKVEDMLNTQEAVDIHTKNIYYNFKKHFF